MNAARSSAPRRGMTLCRGFTIIELLIATALTAIIMVALCIAVTAAMQSCKENGSILESSGRAKLALGQMERTVRESEALVLTSATRLDIVDSTGTAGAFVFNATTKQLNWSFGSPAVTAVLARNVSAVTFVPESAADPDTQVSRIVRMRIDMTIVGGGESKNFTVSVAPRRVRTYQ